MKRAIDILIASAGLIVLIPVFAITAIAIRVDSPGPVFFSQMRVGRHRIHFAIIKFRTMIDREGVNQHEECVVAKGSDARITRVGRVLRATSLDELPQLLNVLRGDMSLVGPRPIIPEQLEVVPDHMLVRFEVRPGITGLAQVSGRRGLDWMEQLKLDSEYSQNHSLGWDFRILIRTIAVVTKGGGVYADPSKNWRAYRNIETERQDQFDPHQSAHDSHTNNE